MTALGIEILSAPENTKEPFFAWAHYMDPHDQYLKHAESPDFGKKARDRYDSEIWYADHFIGKLLDFAREKPWWQNTVVIVSADHGEAFGEHGMYKHAFELWEVLTRVPLFVVGPGIQARRIDERRSHIDLTPTILQLMGVPVPSDMHGQSLLSELEGAPPESRERFDRLSEDHTTHPAARDLRRWKLIGFDAVAPSSIGQDRGKRGSREKPACRTRADESVAGSQVPNASDDRSLRRREVARGRTSQWPPRAGGRDGQQLTGCRRIPHFGECFEKVIEKESRHRKYVWCKVLC